MKKNICKYLLLCISFFFLCICGTVKAASANVSVQTSSSMVVVGRNFNVTVTVSSNVALANWEYTLAYDSSKLDLVSGTPYIMDMVTATNVTTRSYQYTFRAKASGNANIYIQSAVVNGLYDGGLAVNRGSRSVTLKTQAEIEASYSKNNYLSSLGVEGVGLSPEFNKEVLEYTVELEPGTTAINLVGSVEDRTATLEGVGPKEVAEGANRFEVKVTAQNGNVRTYVVVVNVKEYNPIEVEIGGKKYRVVRKRSELTAPANYAETNVTIGEEEVPSYYSEITKYTLVGLKDEEGNIGYYIYNAEENSYIEYKEFAFQRIVLYPMEAKEIPSRYHPSVIVINDQEVKAYKLKESSKYALLYGMNVETGKENLYLYNSEENTLQIYFQEEIELLEQEKEMYQLVCLCLAGGCFFLLLILIIALCRKGKKKEKSIEARHQKRKEKKKKKYEKSDIIEESVSE